MEIARVFCLRADIVQANLATLTFSHLGQAPMSMSVRVGDTVEIPVEIDHAGPIFVEIETDTAPGELINNGQTACSRQRSSFSCACA
jgi:hypothetical protein